MTKRELRVPIWRILLAFALAPVPAALAVACLAMGDEPFGQAHRFASIVFLGLLFAGYPAVLLLGVPAFLLLRQKLRPTALNCGFVGAAIAALPCGLLGLFSVSNYSFDGRHWLVQQGHRTLWGWLEFGTTEGWIALIGAVTGLVFWIVASTGIKPSKPAVETAS